MKIDLQKGKKNVGNAIGKAAEFGKKTADDVKARAQIRSNKAQEENLKAQFKKYNPVFPEQYNEPDFGLPNLIVIVDDAVRKDIDVCKGAIGWKSQVKGVEVFHLYDEAVGFSALDFIPAATCDSVYYVDALDRKRFIRLDCYFEKMQESKLAELQHIAYSLGARKYSVEMYDTSNEKRTTDQKASLKIAAISKKANAGEERSVTAENRTHRESVAFAEFSGDMKPTRPVLRWFALDDNIKNLINMRCSGDDKNTVKTYSIELKGTDYATIGVSTAAKIDGAINGLGLAGSFEMHSKVIEERRHMMRFILEF